MTEVTNKFDLKYTDDLPDEIKSQINRLSIRDHAEKLLSLFNNEYQRLLSIDELVVGMFRFHNIVKDRKWVISTVYNLKRKGYVKGVEGHKNIYELVKK